MSTLQTQTAPLPKVKKPALVDNPLDRVYVLDKTGIYAFTRNSKNVLKKIGKINPVRFLDSWTSEKPINTGILPQGTFYLERFVKDNINHSIVGIQIPPQVYKIKYVGRHATKQLEFNVALPYVQLLAHVTQTAGIFAVYNSRLTCTKMPIVHAGQELMAIPLNNLYPENGTICWGDVKPVSGKLDTDASFCQKLIPLFFQQPFNTDLTPSSVPEFRTIEEYSKMVAADPTISNRITYNSLGYNVQGAIDAIR